MENPPTPPFPPIPAPPSIPPRASPPPIPVTLTIRFATALPDLTISLPDASRTPVSYLKKQIRAARAEDGLGRRRLKLIYAGRVLSTGDGRAVGEQLRLRGVVAPPPPLVRRVVAKGKGKGREGEGEGGEEGEMERERVEVRRAYVHCAVGDEASEEELRLEDMEGAMTSSSPPAGTGSSTTDPTQPPRSTLPPPLGFDRLLTAGFTETDIAQLRAQFNRIHNLSPDSPPETARALEERWIDEAAGTGAGGELADGSPAGTYEDMFLGVAIGFFWPVAVLALREEGVFTKRRGMAIVAGVLVNLLAAVLRVSS